MRLIGVLILFLLPLVHTKITITLYKLKFDFVRPGADLKYEVKITFTTSEAISFLEIPEGIFDITGGLIIEELPSQSFEDLGKLTVEHNSTSKTFSFGFPGGKDLPAGKTYTITLFADIPREIWTKMVDMQTYRVENDIYYLVTAIGNQETGNVFPGFSLIKSKVPLEFSVQIFKNKTMNVFITGNHRFDVEELTDHTLHQFKLDYSISLGAINFIISDIQEVARANDGDTAFRVFVRKSRVNTTTDLFDFVATKFAAGFSAMYSFLGIKHTCDEFNIFLLPKLRPNVHDVEGLIYMPEELVNANSAKDYELLDVIAEKVVYQFYGLLRVSRTDDYHVWIMGLKHYWKYESGFMVKGDSLDFFKYKNRILAMHIDGWSFTPKAIDQETNALNKKAYEEKAGAMFRMVKTYPLDGEFKLETVFQEFYEHNKYGNGTDRTRFRYTLNKYQWGFYDSWLRYGSYPVLNLRLNATTNETILNQERFSCDSVKERSGGAWTYLVHFTSDDYPRNYKYYLFGRWQYADTRVNSPTPGIRYYYIGPGRIEYNSTGTNPLLDGVPMGRFFRVNYHKEAWEQLIEILKTTPPNEMKNFIGEEDRVHLIDDAFSLARAGMIEYTITMRLLEYLPKEMSLSVWEVVYENLKFLLNILKSSKDLLRPNQNYIRALVEPILRKQNDARKSVAVRLACIAELDLCNQLAETLRETDSTLLTVPEEPLVGCRAAQNDVRLTEILKFLNDVNQTDFTKRHYYIQIIACTQNKQIGEDLFKPILWMNSSVFSAYEKTKLIPYILDHGSVEVIEILIKTLSEVLGNKKNMDREPIRMLLIAMPYRIQLAKEREAFGKVVEKAVELKVLSNIDKEQITVKLNDFYHWQQYNDRGTTLKAVLERRLKK